MQLALPFSVATILTVGELGGDPPATANPNRTAPLPYEVNTHQEMGLQAARRSLNLANFLQDFGLTQSTYSRRYPNAAQTAFPQVRILNTTAVDLIGTGCVLEDTEYRFFRHFYDPTNNRGFNRLGAEWQPSFRWGIDGGTETNDHSWNEAFDDFENAVVGTDTAARLAGQEDLFVTLGHVAHLIQDASQPSHVRNDGHGGYGTGSSVLEIYGAANVEPGNIPASIQSAINQRAAFYTPTIRGFFDEAATYANGQFFSDDTIFKDYPTPSTQTTTERTDPLTSGTADFIVSNTVLDPQSSQGQRLARINRGYFWDSYTMASPQDLVVIDNFESLMPGAVALSEGSINHFLRGRIQLSVDQTQTPPVLELKNVSDVAAVGGMPGNVMFSGGTVRIFYETEDGTMRELPSPMSPQSVPGNVAVDGSVPLQGDITGFLESKRAPGLPASERARDDKRSVVLYRGQIGTEEGICAGRITFTNNVSLLLSFDTSGSVSQSEMAAARSAALTLLPILAQGQGNRVAVHRFSSSASIPLPWTGDLGAAQSTISGLFPGGGTALYDAVVLAGNDAFGEATTMIAQKVVLVLFTDGLENSSSASLANAVSAISRVGRPEIDEVFLVFVGGSTSGSNALSAMAAQSGREFFSLSNFNQLTQVFLNIVGSSNP